MAGNGQFWRLAKSAGFRRTTQQHAGTGAIGQEKTQPRTVGVLILVVLSHPGNEPDFTQDESVQVRMRGNALICKE